MLTTKQLLGMTPKNAIAAMLNDLNGTAVSGDDVIYGTPEALGPTLTAVSMTMRNPYAANDFVPYMGEVTFTYNRLDVAIFAALAFVDFNPVLPCTTQALLDELAMQFGVDFNPVDFQMDYIDASNAGNYTLQALPSSLRWVGDYTTSLDNSSDVFIEGTPPNAVVGVKYSYPFLATGGKGPYTWVVNGAPDGITINTQTGVLSGVWPIKGTYILTIIATDVNQTEAVGTFTVVVGATLTVNPTLEINGAYGAAIVGMPYEQGLLITGADGVTYNNPQVLYGPLPPGMTLVIAQQYLQLKGTPTGTFFGLVKVGCSSGDGQSASLYQQLVVTMPLVVNGSYVNGKSGSPYVDALAISGGSGDYFNPELAEGSVLPDGIDTLIIQEGRLEIRGNLGAQGTYPFDVTFQSGYNQSYTGSFSLTIE